MSGDWSLVSIQQNRSLKPQEMTVNCMQALQGLSSQFTFIMPKSRKVHPSHISTIRILTPTHPNGLEYLGQPDALHGLG